jgi:hypothetical protein
MWQALGDSYPDQRDGVRGWLDLAVWTTRTVAHVYVAADVLLLVQKCLTGHWRDDELRQHFVGRLGERWSAEALPLLRAMAQSRDRDTIRSSVTGLIRIIGQETPTLLHDAAYVETLVWLAQATVGAVQRQRALPAVAAAPRAQPAVEVRDHTEFRNTLPELLQGLRDPNPVVRERILQIFSGLDPELARRIERKLSMLPVSVTEIRQALRKHNRRSTTISSTGRTEDIIEGIFEDAVLSDQPVIVQIARTEGDQATAGAKTGYAMRDYEEFASLVFTIAERVFTRHGRTVPYSLHADNLRIGGDTLQTRQEAADEIHRLLRIGFTSVTTNRRRPRPSSWTWIRSG